VVNELDKALDELKANELDKALDELKAYELDKALDELKANELDKALDELKANELDKALDELKAYELDKANELDKAKDADIAYDEVNWCIVPGCPFIDPVILNEPERDMSYASIPVKASIDWETCPGLIVPSEVIPVLDNCFAILL
jgi:hypothetical protein